jgi:class 3 adenylate cyclase
MDIVITLNPDGSIRLQDNPIVPLTPQKKGRRIIGMWRITRRANDDGPSQNGESFRSQIGRVIPVTGRDRDGKQSRAPSALCAFNGMESRRVHPASVSQEAAREKRVERRLAAILAADVVGYSRLMGQDEIGTVTRLKKHHTEFIAPKIAEHKGRIVRTAGDGFLVEFQSVVEAVACAVEIQLAMAERNAGIPEERNILLRIGINLGDIIIEEGEIHGDGVNVAARLEPLAEPGGICVSAIVHDVVCDKFDFIFEDIGEQVLKNIARARRVYRLLLGMAPGAERATNSNSQVHT